MTSIKFTTTELNGYGFDLEADRVVRFNKHPDGTYLNTRATYSINKLQFTHYDLRQLALKERPLGQIVEEKKLTNKRTKWIFILALFVFVAFSSKTCTVKVNGDVVTTESNND